MKIIISERQYKLLTEQDYLTGPGTFYGTYGYDEKGETVWTNMDSHTKNSVYGLLSSFIPVVGPFVAAGIGLYDSAEYYREGDKSSAGIAGLISLLPFVGKIPGVKSVSASVWKTIASKISSDAKLVQSEIALIKEIAKNQGAVKIAVTNASKKLSPLVKEIKKFKPIFIERYGVDEYEKLLRNYIAGTTDQQYFLQSLRGAINPSPIMANFVTKFGIKFSSGEIYQIQKAAINIIDNSENVNRVLVNTHEGKKLINIISVSKDWVSKYKPSVSNARLFADPVNNAVYVISDNTQNMSRKTFEDILTHEFAHIKDPSLVKSPKYIMKYSTEANQGMADWDFATELKKLGFDNEANIFWENGIKRYYLNPNEINANNSMVLQNLATNTENLGNAIGKQKVLNGLKELIDFSKGQIKTLSDNSSNLLGLYDQNISTHFDYLSRNPVEYRKFWTKVAQQADYLQRQIKIAL